MKDYQAELAAKIEEAGAMLSAKREVRTPREPVLLYMRARYIYGHLSLGGCDVYTHIYL